MVFSKKPIHFILVILVALVPIFGKATTSDTLQASKKAETKVLSEDEKKDEERKEFIQHHLLDSHDFHIFSYGKNAEHHVGFPLPVILWDNGLHVFSSSKFDHGEATAEDGGNYYKISHHDGKIYKTTTNPGVKYIKKLTELENGNILDYRFSGSVGNKKAGFERFLLGIG